MRRKEEEGDKRGRGEGGGEEEENNNNNNNNNISRKPKVFHTMADRYNLIVCVITPGTDPSRPPLSTGELETM